MSKWPEFGPQAGKLVEQMFTCNHCLPRETNKDSACGCRFCPTQSIRRGTHQNREIQHDKNTNNNKQKHVGPQMRSPTPEARAGEIARLVLVYTASKGTDFSLDQLHVPSQPSPPKPPLPQQCLNKCLTQPKLRNPGGVTGPCDF